MPTNSSRLVLPLFLAGLFLGISSVFAKDKQYRLTLVFSGPDFKWSQVITYREDFHYFLNTAHFPAVHEVVYIAGVIYPKNGADYISLTIGTSHLNKESGEALGAVKFLKLPRSGSFDIPPIGSPYRACHAQVDLLP